MVGSVPWFQPGGSSDSAEAIISGLLDSTGTESDATFSGALVDVGGIDVACGVTGAGARVGLGSGSATDCTCCGGTDCAGVVIAGVPMLLLFGVES